MQLIESKLEELIYRDNIQTEENIVFVSILTMKES